MALAWRKIESIHENNDVYKCPLSFQGFGGTLRSFKEPIANWTRLSHKIGLQTSKRLRMKKFCYDSLNPSWSPDSWRFDPKSMFFPKSFDEFGRLGE